MNGRGKGGGNELNSSPRLSYPGEKKSLNRNNLTTVLGFASKAGNHDHMTPHHGDEGIKRHANPLRRNDGLQNARYSPQPTP